VARTARSDGEATTERGASFERHAVARIRGALPERLRAVVIGHLYKERPVLEIAAA